ncbi:hypothetical protein [Caulobacter segnis]|nr:hypothetical protein [Caulobacter segnis]
MHGDRGRLGWPLHRRSAVPFPRWGRRDN